MHNKSIIRINELLPNVIQKIKDVSNSPKPIWGISTGFKDLDLLVGGFENSDLIVIGARPAMGKTSFISNLMLNIAYRQSIPTLVFSQDLSETQMTLRLIAAQSQINAYQLKNGLLSMSEWDQLSSTIAEFENVPLYIKSEVNLTVDDLCAQARDAKLKLDIKLIFVDYLQLLCTKQKQENRYQEVAHCTRTLKALAKELNVPIIVTSQINRNPEYRTERRERNSCPEMYDLRDSGTICEDANLVMLLHRPDETFNYELNNMRSENTLEIKIAKNNNGKEGELRLYINSECCHIEDWKTPEPKSLFTFKAKTDKQHESGSQESDNPPF